jgi:hypothetical protein
MNNREVGRIKNIKLNDLTQQLEVTITVTDVKFKKQLLRNFLLSGNLSIEDDKLIFTAKEDDAKI